MRHARSLIPTVALVALLAGLPAPPAGANPAPAMLVPYDALGGLSQGLAYADGYAYIGVEETLEVLDVSDSTAPSRVGLLRALGGAVYRAVAVPPYVYLLLQPSRPNTAHALLVVDVSDPRNPQALGRHALIERASDLAVAGRYAYLATDYGLRILDVADPFHITLAGTANFQAATAVAASGQLVYLGVTSSAGDVLIVLDVADPARPLALASLAYGTRTLQRLALSPPLLLISFAGNPGAVEMVDVSNPKAPRRGARLGSGALSIALGSSTAVRRRAYVVGYASGSLGVDIYDVSDLDRWRLLGTYSGPYGLFELAPAGRFVYVSNILTGLHVLDVSDPAAPVQVGLYDPPGWTLGVAVDDTYLYALDSYGGLRLFDLADPGAPRQIGFGALPFYFEVSTPGAVAVSAGYAYVAPAFGSLTIFDVRDPRYPRQVATGPCSLCRTVAVSGTLAFASGIGAGWYVLDVSDPTQPVQLALVPGYAINFAAQGRYLYVGSSSLLIYDISNLANPTYVGQCPVYASSGGAVAVSGRYVYHVGGWDGLTVCDVADPAHPTVVATLAIPSEAQSLVLEGAYLYAHGYSNLSVIDIGTPTAPRLVARHFHTARIARGWAVAARNGWIYAAGTGAGLLPFRFIADPGPRMEPEALIRPGLPNGLPVR